MSGVSEAEVCDTVRSTLPARFPSRLEQFSAELLSDFSLADITLLAHGQVPFSAHRVILCAGSQVFKDMLMRRTREDVTTISLEHIQPEDLQSILEFLYLGETCVPRDKMSDLIRAAQSLQVMDFDASSSAQLRKEEEGEAEEEEEEALAMDVSGGWGAREPSFPCNCCERKFYSGVGLSQHKNKEHFGQWEEEMASKARRWMKPVNCNLCGTIAYSKSFLQGHLKGKHGVDLCQKCMYQASSTEDMRRHRRRGCVKPDLSL